MSKYGEDISEIKTDVKWIIKTMADDHDAAVKLEKRVDKIEKKMAWYAGAIAVISGGVGFAADHIKDLFNNVT